MKTVFVTLLVVAFVAVNALPVEEAAVEANSLLDTVENKVEDQANGLIREKRQFGFGGFGGGHNHGGFGGGFGGGHGGGFGGGHGGGFGGGHGHGGGFNNFNGGYGGHGYGGHGHGGGHHHGHRGGHGGHHHHGR